MKYLYLERANFEKSAEWLKQNSRELEKRNLDYYIRILRKQESITPPLKWEQYP
jgi:hypothetical protein